MITITREQLQKRSRKRPAGYIEDVLAHAAVSTPDAISLEIAAWQALCQKYRRRQPAPPPALTPEEQAVIKARFEICKQCPHSLDKGFACGLHKKCCFGAWRSNLAHDCPDNPPKWIAQKESA